nr:helix-turn-helix transcriptional regulator [Deinococcus sp. 23YEL01]
MDSRGLSQSGLAREVYIDQGTLSKLLTGVRAFSKAYAKALSRFFQVPVELFL